MLCGLAPGLPPENQAARRLAENGCEVLVPVLISRQDTWSGSAQLDKWTNQPHREWIYRQAFELGRHVIGYEIQKVLAAVDWFTLENNGATGAKPPVAVAGYGEGGLIAFYSAALDLRIQAVLVSGYYDARQRLWEEPIYRNVFGLLREFGDAEIASLVAPRGLVVEYSPVPRVEGPPPIRPGRSGAAPGRLVMPERFAVEHEVERARGLFPTNFPFQLDFVYGNEGTAVGPFCNQALVGLFRALGLAQAPNPPAAETPADARAGFDPGTRQKAQLEQMVAVVQNQLAWAERARDGFFWNKLEGAYTNDWAAACKLYREQFWDEVIGRLPKPGPAGPARTRSALEKPKWLGYEVVLDLNQEVFAWGYLLIPRDIRPGERRPVVVCQHGLEGVPLETINAVTEPGFDVYRGFASRLAERGFVVFAPHNPYRGGDAFRVLQRKANPLKLSLFSFITAQHDRILDWLGTLPFVDAQRIGFYGLSYGGKTAMRVPAVLDRYALSICSADFNDWVRKVTTVDSPYGYPFTGEYELPEFNLGPTFNYAEMAALIAPRPFMVERGHFDGVAPDEWVAYEYAPVRRLYARLGYPERTAIEFFEGPHAINGVGTFQFLYRHLNWQGR
jgi:dienelactone hydrolase